MENNILVELSRPFHPSRITWRAGAVKRDKTKALALAYADPRTYMARLDEVCGMEWSVSYTPWDDKIICHVTIKGITRSSTGEPDSDSERNELSGTVAEAQAFKRACAMFGLGRYLYEMPSVWVDYDADGGRFTAQALAKLNKLVTDHYVKAGSAALDRIPSVSDPAQPEEDFGMGEGWDDIPGASGPVDWAALAGKLTGDCAKFAEWAYEKHTGGAGPCSPKQYQFLTSLVDGLTGKQHTKVLSVLCRRDVSSENPPSGDMVKPLLDWLSPKSDKFSQAYADCIKNIGAI